MTYYYSSWYKLYFRETPAGIGALDRLHFSRWGWAVHLKYITLESLSPVPDTCILLVGGPVQP